MLEPPDSHHLRAAIGWLELGNALEASRELDRIAPPLQAHPDVLAVRWHLAAHTRQWETCAEIAATMIQLDPAQPEPWIHRSFALHELKRTAEAFEQLVCVADDFPEVWTIPYNLACYCAQLGRLDDGEAWFKKAWAIDADAAGAAALVDPDLKPIREKLRNLLNPSQ
jgi:tetratricopeptide (TPR) repeat protein